jgi:hypothetical protein
MRSSHKVVSAVGGLLVTLLACSSQPSVDTTAGALDGGDGTPVDDVDGGTATTPPGPKDAGKDAKTPPKDSGTPPVVVIGPAGADKCESATVVPITDQPRIDLGGNTTAATHDIDVPCSSGQSPDVFYKIGFSKRVMIYADTFGANWNTVLFLLSDSCVPITTSTTSGDAVCSDDACGTTQSRLVAMLEPGYYRLGLSGAGGAKGAATIHFEWTLAGSGAVKPLPQGDSVQTGATAGSGNITALSSDCIAAGGEDSYWWARCPSDPAGTLTASTCGGATWESIVEVQVPRVTKYQCALDTCGLQSSLSTAIPAGAGLGVVSVDGDTGGDFGAYTLDVSRP